MELVSVIIPTYKRPVMLERAITSILNQTYNNIEIIVVDDNEPNSIYRRETEEIINKYNVKHLKYIQHPKNLNGSAARNTGIQASNGKFIAFLDNDDYFLPEKVKKQVDRLQALSDGYGCCYTQFVRKKNGAIIDKGTEKREGILTIDILMGNFYISSGSNILIRKSLLDSIIGFDESFKRRQDLEFLVRLSKITKICCVNETLLVINKDDKSNNLDSILELEKNKKMFVNVFKDSIESFNLDIQGKILKSQSLINSRYFIQKKDIVGLVKYSSINNVSVLLQFRHILYLFHRKLFKKCYGFRI